MSTSQTTAKSRPPGRLGSGTGLGRTLRWLVLLSLAGPSWPLAARAGPDLTSGNAEPRLLTVAEHSRPEEVIRDPFEPFNRTMFRLNDELDLHVLEPAARGWAWLVPHPLRTGIVNFYENLLFPVRLANTTLRGRFKDTAIETGRFALNSTIGLGGVLDPAARLGLEAHRADFGQTLGRWGTPAGPYLVWPIWGPSSVRDTFGVLVDGYLGVATFFVDVPILVGSTGLDALNRRSMHLEDMETARGASLDLYAAARDAWEQEREEAILGPDGARAAREESLYFLGE